MTRIKLKNIDRFTDRHGKTRCYYRPDRGARIALPGVPGSPEFMLAYEDAARGKLPDKKPRQRGEPGTFDRLVQDYFMSSEFLRLSPATQYPYRLIIERLLREENIGHRLVREMTREHVKRIVSRRAFRRRSARLQAASRRRRCRRWRRPARPDSRGSDACR